MRAPVMFFNIILYLVLVCSTASKSINKEAPCDETNASFFVIDNASINSEDYLVYKDTSEEECMKTCSHNRDQYNRPIVCNSFTYDHASFACTIFKEKSVPAGSAHVETSPGKRYFEKMCLSHSMPTECAKAQFIRVDQSVLVGYAVNMTLTDSIESCVAQCVHESDCKSAMYFYEDGECITNKESALTKPTGFTKEENDRVVYFQNGCDPSSIKISTPTVEESDKSVVTEKTEESFFEDGEKPEVVTQISETTPKPVSEGAGVIDTVTTDNTNDQSEEDEEYEEGTDETSEQAEEQVSEPITTTKTTTTTETPSTTTELQKPKRINSLVQKKIMKHPKNFGSKTYEILKNQETVKKAKTEDVDSDSIETTKSHEETEETYFSEWSDWTPCTKSQERQVRRRRCLNLRKCLGALMQVQNCPVIIQTSTPKHPESVRSVVSVDGDEYDEPIAVDNISVDPLPSKVVPVMNEQVWGPWQGSCQQFASSQPCNNGNMIGFESRECIAKDPSECEGPFFRYCTLTC